MADAEPTFQVLDAAGRWAPAVLPHGPPLILPPQPVAWWRRVWRPMATAVSVLDVADVLVGVGLLLLARGCYLVSPAAGWIAPGVVLLWYALPQRPRFLQPKPPPIMLPPSPPPEPRSPR